LEGKEAVGGGNTGRISRKKESRRNKTAAISMTWSVLRTCSVMRPEARLIKKVYGTDPLVCPWLHGRARNEVSDQPKCGSEMKIIAIIMEPEEIEKILRHLLKIGWSQTTFAARHAPGAGPAELGY
jgi:hypothetical protein